MERFGIFVINLDRSLDRFATVHHALRGLGFEPVRIPAVDGHRLSQDQIKEHYDEVSNRLRFERDLNPGEIGCYLSHLRCWREIIARSLDFAIILEDDVVPMSHLGESIEFLRETLTAWDYVKLIDPYNPKTFRPVMTRGSASLVRYNKVPSSTMAQAVSRAGAQLLLDSRNRFHRPVDIDIQYFWENRLRIHGLVPYSFRPTPGESAIEAFGRRRTRGSRRVVSVLRKASFWVINQLHRLRPVRPISAP